MFDRRVSEYSGDSTELLYLRARYYSNGKGRFLTKDAWMGDASSPTSFNHWIYADANPINLVDPSGHNPDCPFGAKVCAERRFIQINYIEHPTNGALALIQTFEDGELYSLWGDYAGRTVDKRLEWLLETTHGHKWKPTHFKFRFSNCGLAEEFRDDQLYIDYWNLTASDTNQVGHFLTAVHIAYYNWNLGFLIAHEQSSDLSGLWNELGYAFVSTEDFNHWDKAIEYDIQGKSKERDEELWAILHFDSAIAVDPNYADRDRQGNSLQDLRLSLKGLRFARWVKQHADLPANAAGYWLRTHLTSSGNR